MIKRFAMTSYFHLAISFFILVLMHSAHAEEAKASGGDIYYLKEHVSIVTDSGVVRLNPGTKLFLIAKTPDGIKARTDDGVQAEVKNSQITEDAQLGAILADEDSTKVAGQQAQLAAAIQAAGDQQKQADEQRQKALSRLIMNPLLAAPAPSIPPLTGAALDNPAPTKFKMRPAKKNK